MHFLADYGLFLIKTITFVAALLVAVAGIVAIGSRGKDKKKGTLIISNLNKKYQNLTTTIHKKVLPKKALKKYLKDLKQQQKAQDKQDDLPAKKRIFVLDYQGDIRASATSHLSEEITALLTIATPEDEVVVKIESGGGVMHGYGLAASQLNRLTEKNIPLTIAIDKVAASGGYMMACVGTKIIAAPFAIVGSIGVLVQLPNFHKLLKKHNIEFEQLSAGEYKRTLTLFGENTEQGREKLQEDIDDAHILFKDFIKQHREQVDLDKVATGEYWYGTRAIEHKLVDQLITSDDYLLTASQQADIFQLVYRTKKKLSDKVADSVHSAIKALHSKLV